MIVKFLKSVIKSGSKTKDFRIKPGAISDNILVFGTDSDKGCADEKEAADEEHTRGWESCNGDKGCVVDEKTADEEHIRCVGDNGTYGGGRVDVG